MARVFAILDRNSMKPLARTTHAPDKPQAWKPAYRKRLPTLRNLGNQGLHALDAQITAPDPSQTTNMSPWLAMTFKNDRVADRLYFAAVAKCGSTDLGPHLQPIFATDWPGLSAD
ncbi:hypothetical protein LBMAG57_32300 [Verrucomicrobiota bacterium]|nr:hypothetical protein LBMAG57_32300 [Verrucomicrobiota bacterium]